MPMPEDLSFLDQLEEWLEAQVPTNLHELPYRLLETMERVSHEIFETLNMHGPPSISIPFPPFTIMQSPPPLPPPPPPSMLTKYGLGRVERLYTAHPYYLGAGAALALTVGLGAGGMMYKKGFTLTRRNKRMGAVSDGMLKDAIVILAPSPLPPLLWSLSVSLLRAGYIVLIAVPNVEDAEQLEKKLSGLEERNALRVLIYDPEQPSSFPPFHRSLQATLTLRFASPNVKGSNDPYNPSPDHIPRIHSFISLYPLNPSPPTQPGALPALPTLFTPTANGKTPQLVTIYPSASALVQPDSFANQLLSSTHRLLGENVSSFSNARTISVYLGDIYLPPVQTTIIGGGEQLTRRQQARQTLAQASAAQKVNIVKEYFGGYFNNLVIRFKAYTGIGTAGRQYDLFESSFLTILRSRQTWRQTYHLGQYSYLTHFLSRLPSWTLPRILPVLPVLPNPNGPGSDALQGYSVPKRPQGNAPRGPRARTPLPSHLTESTAGSAKDTSSQGQTSASSSDHEAEMMSSFHTTGTTSSGEYGMINGNQEVMQGSEMSSIHNLRYEEEAGLGDSWVGLDSVGNQVHVAGVTR